LSPDDVLVMTVFMLTVSIEFEKRFRKLELRVKRESEEVIE
jgi:hypothetical protein